MCDAYNCDYATHHISFSVTQWSISQGNAFNKEQKPAGFFFFFFFSFYKFAGTIFSFSTWKQFHDLLIAKLEIKSRPYVDYVQNAPNCVPVG